MPVLVACPECERVYRAPDDLLDEDLAQRFQCPKCKTAFDPTASTSHHITMPSTRPRLSPGLVLTGFLVACLGMHVALLPTPTEAPIPELEDVTPDGVGGMRPAPAEGWKEQVWLPRKGDSLEGDESRLEATTLELQAAGRINSADTYLNPLIGLRVPTARWTPLSFGHRERAVALWVDSDGDFMELLVEEPRGETLAQHASAVFADESLIPTSSLKMSPVRTAGRPQLYARRSYQNGWSRSDLLASHRGRVIRLTQTASDSRPRYPEVGLVFGKVEDAKARVIPLQGGRAADLHHLLRSGRTTPDGWYQNPRLEIAFPVSVGAVTPGSSKIYRIQSKTLAISVNLELYKSAPAPKAVVKKIWAKQKITGAPRYTKRSRRPAGVIECSWEGTISDEPCQFWAGVRVHYNRVITVTARATGDPSKLQWFKERVQLYPRRSRSRRR